MCYFNKSGQLRDLIVEGGDFIRAFYIVFIRTLLNNTTLTSLNIHEPWPRKTCPSGVFSWLNYVTHFRFSIFYENDEFLKFLVWGSLIKPRVSNLLMYSSQSCIQTEFGHLSWWSFQKLFRRAWLWVQHRLENLLF